MISGIINCSAFSMIIYENLYNKIFFKIIIVLLLLIRLYLNDLKTCLCVIGKNENLYINEFINYYKELGYSKIFLYDNNDIDGERFDSIIKIHIENGFVDLINFRGIRGSNINQQLNAYRDCYEKNSMKFDWLSFFDIDEYLKLIPSNIKIYNFLNDKRYKHCQNIKINWICFNSNNSLFYENKSLEERVNIPILNSEINIHIKSTVRGKLPINYWSLSNNPHTSENNFTACSSSGKIIDYKSPYNAPPDYKYAHLNHLHNKSFEEYCIKIKRGRPLSTYKMYREEMIKYLLEKNKNNLIKIKIIMKIFNITNYKTIK